jgi:hypothetical protein
MISTPLKITEWGHFKDSKWSRHKIETFRGWYVLYSGIKIAIRTQNWGRIKRQENYQVNHTGKG